MLHPGGGSRHRGRTTDALSVARRVGVPGREQGVPKQVGTHNPSRDTAAGPTGPPPPTHETAVPAPRRHPPQPSDHGHPPQPSDHARFIRYEEAATEGSRAGFPAGTLGRMTQAEQRSVPRPARPAPLRDAPPTVEQALRRMTALKHTLPGRDGVAVFNGVYLSVTQEVEDRLSAGHFHHGPAAEELTARFAARYLAAVDAASAGRPPAASWRPLFELRRHPAVRPVQFALSGINAHIGNDLALALRDTCVSLGCEPATLEGDFDRVGDVLTGMEERVREELMPGPDLLDIADPLTHLVGSWSLDRARDSAWGTFRALWGLREQPELAREFAERVDASVGLVGRFLLTPLPTAA